MLDLFLQRDATISECGKYRYLLSRIWDPVLERVLFIMLNPSTADAEIDDPTIRSCMRLSRDWGYGGLTVVNLFAWRATKPAELCKAADPVGPENDRILLDAVQKSSIAICAWGAHSMAVKRAEDVCRIIQQGGLETFCLGTTQSGAPKHPLYIPTGTAPSEYRIAPVA